VSTKTKRYWCFFTLGMLIKSICQSSPGMCPLAWWVVNGPGLREVCGLVL
jgi:hypothetical protein